MNGAIEVSDSLSNTEVHIERAAKIIGRGDVRPKVFAAIYDHKKRVKSTSEVMAKSGVKSRLRVLQEARHLVKKGLAREAKKGGEPGYEMIDFIHANKRQILRLAANPKQLARFSAKRNPSISVAVKATNGRIWRPKAVALSVDDFESFGSLSKVKPDGFIPRNVSEDQFKRGMQAILGEPGDWRDWGGELFDLSSTQLVYKGKRIGAVFAFKGPGTRGTLTPRKMGTNGDQVGRMYKGVGRVFVLQYGESISESLRDLMRTHAVEKSDASGEVIYYVVIDGTDSHRLYRAYPDEFAKAKGKKAKRSH